MERKYQIFYPGEYSEAERQALLDALPEMPVTSNMMDVAMFYLEKKSAEYFQEISHD